MATLLAGLELSVREHLTELPALDTPEQPTITNVGTTGSTSYSYKVSAMHSQGESNASAAGSTATGHATPNATRYNHIVWVSVTGATSYKVYRTEGGATQGLIGVVGDVTEFNDQGLVADEDEAAPTTNTSGGQYWTSDEIVGYLNRGIKDMWGAVIDLNQEHFQTVVETVTLAAEATQLASVPTDCFRVLLIEPADTTTGGTHPYIVFRPKDYNSHEFINARAQVSLDPSSGLIIYYTLTQAGAPIGAPTILTGPKVSSALTLRMAYVPTAPTKTSAQANPIPGESDNALIAWGVAYARAKERQDRAPDPNWLTIYATEKTNVLVRLTPRQTQEPEVVDSFFGGQW